MTTAQTGGPVPVVSSATPRRRAELARANAITGEALLLYPERDTPHPFVPVRTALLALLQDGVDEDDLLIAARTYRTQVEGERTPPKYVVGPVRFYRDGMWRRFAAPRVGGLTREQWARSGRDVADFDRAVAGVAHG